MTLVIIIAIIAAVIFSVIGIYNNLVKLRNNRENAFADIDVQLKQGLTPEDVFDLPEGVTVDTMEAYLHGCIPDKYFSEHEHESHH